MRIFPSYSLSVISTLFPFIWFSSIIACCAAEHLIRHRHHQVWSMPAIRERLLCELKSTSSGDFIYLPIALSNEWGMSLVHLFALWSPPFYSQFMTPCKDVACRYLCANYRYCLCDFYYVSDRNLMSPDFTLQNCLVLSSAHWNNQLGNLFIEDLWIRIEFALGRNDQYYAGVCWQQQDWETKSIKAGSGQERRFCKALFVSLRWGPVKLSRRWL